MAAEAAGMNLGHAVALLAAGVVAVPLFRKLGLGSVLGYLAAGLVIGPYGLKLFSDPEAILHVAELGVVLFLFVIGLEMRPAKLWSLRREIFGLGVTQVLVCCALLSGIAMLSGMPPAAAVIGASGFVLSSTAVIMKMLDERGETSTEAGQRAVSILLLEDLAVVPLLALVVVLGSMSGVPVEGGRPAWVGLLIGLGCIAAVIAAGRWLINPVFQILARTGPREIMNAAALQVVSVNGTMTIALMCLTAAGQSVAFPNVGAIISRTADPHRQGQILGLNNATGALARVVGPICAGLMVPVVRDGPFILGALVVAPAILLALSATRRAMLRPEQPEPMQ